MEILQGPYLVKPSAEAFDNGERPINVVANNIIWLDSADVTWIKQASSAANAASMAFLWGKPEPGHRNGSFVKLPAGFSGQVRGNDAWLRAVIIQGLISHRTDAESKRNELKPGSYFGSTGSASQHIACSDDGECVIYVSTEGKYEVVAR